jgi:hypothetical protein
MVSPAAPYAMISPYAGTAASDTDGSVQDEPLCEDTSPTTGRKCRSKASVVSTRFGEPFLLCGECALRHYLHDWQWEN